MFSMPLILYIYKTCVKMPHYAYSTEVISFFCNMNIFNRNCYRIL